MCRKSGAPGNITLVPQTWQFWLVLQHMCKVTVVCKIHLIFLGEVGGLPLRIVLDTSWANTGLLQNKPWTILQIKWEGGKA